MKLEEINISNEIRKQEFLEVLKMEASDIHITDVGTLFPGGLRVKYENKTYYCPVKESQNDNPNAICGFCIAKQDKNI